MRSIDPPASPGAFAPDLWVDEAGVLLTWLEPLAGEGAGHRVRFARFDGAGWSAPTTVVEGGDLFANWADFPSAARTSRGDIVVHWLAKTAAATYAYSIELARSVDGGASWERLGRLNDDATHTEHGFVSWVREGEALRAFWLDGREMVQGGPMTLRTARVDVRSTPPVGAAEVLDERVCECCSTDATLAASGPLAVFRDRSEEEIRDVGIVRRSGSEWRASSVWSDEWTIAGCPVNGPEADADGDVVAVTWFTGASQLPRVQASFSSDGGATFRSPFVIDGGDPLGRADTALDGSGGAVVSWMSRGDERAEVRLRRVTPGGPVGEPLSLGSTSWARASGCPRLERWRDSVLVAWVDLEEGRPGAVRVTEIPLARLR